MTQQSHGAADPTPDSDSTPDSELSYEAARDELLEVVRRLETGGSTLAESLQLWERGEKLAEICQRWLDGARARVERSNPSAGADSGPTQ